MTTTIQAIAGIAAILGLAYVLSEGRERLDKRLIGAALAAQLVLGGLLLRVPALSGLLAKLSAGVAVLEEAALAGATFMFGYLVTGAAPFEVTNPSASFIVAFRVLPLILLVSAISEVLFHLGILPSIIRGLARLIKRTFRVSGALAFAAAGSVFFGIIEGPILIKPYIAKLDRSELFALMVCGMSTVAGTVMVLYASTLEPALPGALGHILVASVMSVPAALAISHIMIPPANQATEELEEVDTTSTRSGSVWVALMRGVESGTKMVVAIVATLIVLFALVHLANKGLGLLPSWSEHPITLQRIVGLILRPLVLAMGIPWSEASAAGELMGTKVILNEFVAYLQLAALPEEALSARSRMILTYGMCGFANLGSLGILVGGLSPLMPERQDELVSLASRAVLAGVLATTLTGSIVAIVAP